MKIILYLLVASSFLAAKVLTIHIGFMELSIFRGTLILSLTYLILDSLKSNMKFKLSLKNDSSLHVKFYFIWFLYSIITLGWVQDYNSWFRAVFFIGIGFSCVLVISHYIKNIKDFFIMFDIMLVMIAIHNIIGWYEVLTGKFHFVTMSVFDPYNRMLGNAAMRTPVSVFENPNNYAILMVFGVFISYICFTITKSKVWKIFSIITLISSIILCFKADSRANIIGLIIGIFLLVYFRFFVKINIKSLLIIPVLILIVAFSFENISLILSDKLYFDFNNTYGSDHIRMNLILNGLIFLKDTWGFGTGAGNIEYWMKTRRVFDVGRTTNIHNWWMEILVGYGVIIFILYLFLYFQMIKKLYYSMINTNDKTIKTICIGLLCCIFSFVIGSISPSSNISSEWLWVFWSIVIAFLGYLEKYNKINMQKSNE